MLFSLLSASKSFCGISVHYVGVLIPRCQQLVCAVSMGFWQQMHVFEDISIAGVTLCLVHPREQFWT